MGAMCPADELPSEVPLIFIFDSYGFNVDLLGTCAPGDFDGPDQTLLFTAPQTGTYVFDTLGTDFDTVLYLLDSCNGPELSCNDDVGGGMLQSETSAQLDEGQSVIVVVDGLADDDVGPYSLNVDLLCNPVDLGSPPLPHQELGDTAGNGKISGQCGGSGPEDLFIYTAEEDGIYLIDTFGSDFDTVLYILDDNCGGEELACNDDAMGLDSAVQVGLTNGQSVVIAVDGLGEGSSGAYTLNIDQFICDVTDLGSPNLPHTEMGMTSGSSQYVGSCGGNGPEIFYSFTATEAGSYTFDTFGTGFDTVLYVMDAICGGNELGCDDDEQGVQSQVIVDLAADQTVVIGVDGFGGGNAGNTLLNISFN